MHYYNDLKSKINHDVKKMPIFDNKGIKIYYEIIGEGPDLFLVHGFASNLENNWKSTNWVKTLKDSNRLILIDNRGHGKSGKPLDSNLYGANMVTDILGLMDHLSIKQSNFFGYSMGSSLTLSIIINYPEKVKGAILGGYTIPMTENTQTKMFHSLIVDALKVENKDMVKNPVAKQFRVFAESTGENLAALAAVMESMGNVNEPKLSNEAQIKKTLKNIKIPILSVCGSDDVLLQNKTMYAELVPGACHFQIQGKDHLTVVADAKFHLVVKEFLKYINKSS